MFTSPTNISPRILPYLPLPSLVVLIITEEPTGQSSFTRSLAASPNFFSSKSLVLLSGVLIPYNLILLLYSISEP